MTLATWAKVVNSPANLLSQTTGVVGEARLEHPSALFAKLREARLEQELTLEWVADKVGVKAPSIHEFETGKKRPTDKTLRAWVKALKLPDAWADDGADWLTAEAMVKENRGRLRDRRVSQQSEAYLIESIYRDLRGLRR